MTARRAASRLATIAATGAMLLVSGCSTSSSDDAPSDEGTLGCGFVPKAALASALGTKSLSSTGSSTPDPETKLTTCRTTNTLKRGASVFVQVSDATPSALDGRDNWRSETPRANPACTNPTFINSGDLGGVACTEAAATGTATRLYVVSPTHIIVVTLALGGEAAPEDVDTTLMVAQAVEKGLT
jgi:hypothetical protein